MVSAEYLTLSVGLFLLCIDPLALFLILLRLGISFRSPRRIVMICQTGSSVQKLMPIRILRTLLAGLLTFILVLTVPRGLSLGASVDTGLPNEIISSDIPALAASAIIPISEQPFYPFLLETYHRWATVPLSSVVGDSPSDTLLNFYAIMTHVTNYID